MVPYVCDDPDRLPARIFRALGTDCPCCAFWRGFVAGLIVAAVGFLGAFLTIF